MPTAVVIGSGPNGLAAAVTLARAGWSVTVHEAEETIGGGTRSAELTLPGFVHDVCSAIHPLGEHSPFFGELNLPVEFIHPEAPAAHPLDDGTAVMLERSVDDTAEQLGPDARAYRRLLAPLVENWPAIEPVLVGPHMPPARRVGQLVRALGIRTAQRSLRAALSDARSLAESTFATDRAQALFRGPGRALDAAHGAASERRLRARADAARARVRLGHAEGRLAAGCGRARRSPA